MMTNIMTSLMKSVGNENKYDDVIDDITVRDTDVVYEDEGDGCH